MRNECCIPGCKHKEGIHRNISFYNFPDQVSDFIAYRCWLREVRKFKSDCGETFDPVEDVLICENHFRNEDFSIDLETGRKVLKHGSVPCLMNNYSSNESDVEVVSIDQETEGRNFDRIEYNEIKPAVKKTGQSKNFEHFRLLQEKEEQEEKLRRLLAQQEEHRGRFASKKQTQNKIEYDQKEQLNKQRRAKQLLELEEKQRQLTEAQAKMKERKNKVEQSQNNNKQANCPVVWKQKKENLQQMLEQQKERRAEIQKQESLYGSKKRKRQTDSPTPRDAELDKVPKIIAPTSKINTQSVISCGKCIKLEADLRLISQQYIELKKENEQLKFELSQKQ